MQSAHASHGSMLHQAGRHLQDGHAVCRRKDDAQRQTVLQRCTLCSACMLFIPLCSLLWPVSPDSPLHQLEQKHLLGRSARGDDALKIMKSELEPSVTAKAACQRKRTDRLRMLGSCARPYSTSAISANAVYVPRMPNAAMVPRLRKNCFFFTDRPA